MCSVEGCEGRVFSRGWCRKHYARWQRHGDPTFSKLPMDLSYRERVELKIDRSDPAGCWLWQGRLSAYGYAVAKVEGREVLVHRWLWEQHNGPMPRELVSDHLCRIRNCVNPDHIEPVSNDENVARGESPGARAVRNNLCKRGHNLNKHGYVRPDGRGRECLACNQIRRGKAA